MKNEIDYYVQNILKKQLKGFGISNQGLYAILNNVKMQLDSLIYHWNDVELRDAFLIIGSEEGTFYEPKADVLVNNLVVVTVRNSLFETIASVDYYKYGLSRPIKSDDIKEVTSRAINYFIGVDLVELGKKITLENDFYYNVSLKYPVAYKALVELSKCHDSCLEHSFLYEKDYEPFVFEELKKESSHVLKTNYESGISENFNESLIHLLKGIKNGESQSLYVDCFKFLTRNVDKLFKILEFILTHNGLFITNNYLITINYVAKRKNLIRARHGDGYNEEAIKTLSEISVLYRDFLQKISLVLL